MRSTSGRLVSFNPRFSYPGKKPRRSTGRPPRSSRVNLRESADPPLMEGFQGNPSLQTAPQLVPPDWQALTNLPASENGSTVSWQASKQEATEVKTNNEEHFNIEQVLAEFDCQARYIQRQKIENDNPANLETVIRWQVETDQGPLVIKELAGPGAVEQATNIVDLLNHLHNNGFTHCPVPLASKFGEKVIDLKGQAYYVYPCLTGKPVKKLARARDFRDAGQILALFHQAGMGFRPVKKSPKTSSLPEKYRSGQAAITSWRQMVEKQRFFSNADELLREKLPQITERTGKVFQWLGPLYDRKYREAEELKVVCYGRFSEKALIQANQGLYLENFEWCCPDTPLMDVATFLADITMAARDGWKHGIAFLEGYERTYNLSTDCRHFILGYMLLPHSLWQHVSERLRHPPQEITVIPHRMLQNQVYKQAYRAVDLCRRLFFGARRLAVHAQIELPS